MVFHLGTLMPLAREAPPSFRLPPLTGGRRSYHLLGTSQDIPADQAATEFEEYAVNVSTALETNTEATEVMQPSMYAVDDPAMFP